MREGLRIKKLCIRGFKSISNLDFPPSDLNILIGPNGSGKSNFISFFRMMSYMTQAPGQLQKFISMNGRAVSILHDGPQVTRSIDGEIVLETSKGENEYVFQLTYAAGDTLIFTEEKFRFSKKGFASKNEWASLLPMGHLEPRIVDRAETGEVTARTILGLVRSCVVYQFHNTAMTARIRNSWPVDDNRWIKEDGANLAAFLFRLKEAKAEYYKRIVEYLRISIPFFADFILEPLSNRIILQWREVGSDMVFGAHMASDGMLRYIALVTLLAQPPEELPPVLILDEPELGLHPYAINVIAGLIKSASMHSQIIIATQSPTFIDNFDLENIVVLERKDRETVFKKLNEEDFKEWLESYSISELWEKNVLGGRPSK